jgi:hypothetical protein
MSRLRAGDRMPVSQGLFTRLLLPYYQPLSASPMRCSAAAKRCQNSLYAGMRHAHALHYCDVASVYSVSNVMPAAENALRQTCHAEKKTVPPREQRHQDNPYAFRWKQTASKSSPLMGPARSPEPSSAATSPHTERTPPLPLLSAEQTSRFQPSPEIRFCLGYKTR